MNEPGPVLTPREWQVLELLRRGFADHQIAQVLGITESDARQHVSSVVGKLQLTRDEVTASRPHEPAAPQPPATASEPGRAGGLAMKIALGVLAVIAAVAVAVVGLSLISDDDRATAPNGGEQVGGPDVRPLVGEDHWHAGYEIIICGEQQPPIATFAAGVHTHADGFIHIHPQAASEEGLGASLAKFFEYGGGLLTSDTLRVPGSSDTYTNGDTCPNGLAGFLQLTANGEPIDDVTRFIPQDGDTIVISFGQ